MACVSPSDDDVLIQCNPTYVRVNILTHAYIHLSTCLMDRIYQVPPISPSLPGPVLQFKRAPSNLNYIFILVFVIYFVTGISIYFLQRKLLYHPAVDNYLNEKNLNHKIQKIYVKSVQAL